MIDRLVDWVENHFLAALYAVLLALVVLLVGVFWSLAHAATATVTWTHPTSRIDGTALTPTEIKATRIAYGKCPATDTVVDVPAPASSWISPDLGYGTWCFKAATVDQANLVSDYTGIVQKVHVAPPSPPRLLSVGGFAYDVKNANERVVGVIPEGKPCGSVAVTGDLSPVERADVQLLKPLRPGSVLAARCAPASL